MSFILSQIISSKTLLVLFNPSACASLTPHLSTYMASAQVDAAKVKELTIPSEEKTLGSPTIEGSPKAPAPQDIESPYDEDVEEPEDVILSDKLGKEEELVDEEDQKTVAPHLIEVGDDEDEDAEEGPAKSAVRGSDFSEEEGDDDD